MTTTITRTRAQRDEIQRRARNAEMHLHLIQSSPATPTWALAVIDSALDRDPVDAAHVLARLASIFADRAAGYSL